MHNIEYKIRFLLNSQTMRIISIDDCTDSKHMLDFNNVYCDTKKIQSFCTNIGEVTKFPLQSIPVESNSSIHTVYFCEVAVGKSVFVSKSYANSLSIPQGCDSLIIDDEDTSGYLTEKNIDIKKCSYIIKNQNQILPLYKVTFEYDEEFEKRFRGKNICNKCAEEDSVMFCPSERASFCSKCDDIVHSDTFLKRHERKYFSEIGQKKFVCCQNHPTKTAEYFCEACLDLICTECKISGDHSTKLMSDHKISPFINACGSISKTVLEGDVTLKNYSDKLKSQLSIFQKGVEEFKDNVSIVRKQLEKDFKNLMLQLDAIESKKRSSINADFIERKLKKTEIDQMVEYPLGLDPADRLISFKNIIQQRSSEKVPEFPHLEPLKIELQGKTVIRIPSAEDEKKLKNSSALNKAVAWRIETMNINE